MNVFLTVITIILAVFCIAFGIAESVVYGVNVNNLCGINTTSTSTWGYGAPPLSEWLLGAAIGDLIVGALLGVGLIIALTTDIVPLLIIGAVCGLFEVVWTSIGIASWLKNGIDCITGNNSIWTMAATRVMTFIGLLPALIVLLPNMKDTIM